MWALKQLWVWLFMAAAVLAFIAYIAGAVKYKTKLPLWGWILLCIAGGLAILGLLTMVIQLSLEKKREAKMRFNSC